MKVLCVEWTEGRLASFRSCSVNRHEGRSRPLSSFFFFFFFWCFLGGFFFGLFGMLHRPSRRGQPAFIHTAYCVLRTEKINISRAHDRRNSPEAGCPSRQFPSLINQPHLRRQSSATGMPAMVHGGSRHAAEEFELK